MAFSPLTYAASVKYATNCINDSLSGIGAIAGKPCKIKNIQSDGNNNIVTFEWTDDNGNSKVSTMTVTNGINGQDGITPHIDDTTKRWFIGDSDTGYVAVPNNPISYNDLKDLPLIPIAISELVNDKNFIDNTVSNLVHYYTKSDTYSRNEITALLKNINRLTTAIVDELPIENISTSTIYLIPVGDSVYEQHMYINDTWADLGSTDVDLSGYINQSTLQAELSKKSDINHAHQDIHKHENKAILDSINQERISKWESKFSGNYNDLTNKPTIPVVSNNLTNELKELYDAAAENVHKHQNLKVLNKFGEVEGKLQYNGKDISSISGGSSNVEGSTKNGYIKINNINTKVYDDSVLNVKATHSNRDVLDQFGLTEKGELLFNNTLLGFHTTSYSETQNIDTSEIVQIFDLSKLLDKNSSILNAELLVKNKSEISDATVIVYDTLTELMSIHLCPGETQKYILGSSKHLNVHGSGNLFLKLDITIV